MCWSEVNWDSALSNYLKHSECCKRSYPKFLCVHRYLSIFDKKIANELRLFAKFIEILMSVYTISNNLPEIIHPKLTHCYQTPLKNYSY